MGGPRPPMRLHQSYPFHPLTNDPYFPSPCRLPTNPAIRLKGTGLVHRDNNAMSGVGQVGCIMQPTVVSLSRIREITMSILHVRNIPDDLYQRIQRRAEAQGRSITAEVVSLLERAIEDADTDQAQVLAGIRRRRFFSPAEAGAPDSTTLLREDRQR